MSDNEQGNESQHGVSEDLAARVGQRRREIVARRQAIEDGTAPPEVYEAIERACAVADEAPEESREQIRRSVAGIVSDEFAQREREGKPAGPAEIDAAVRKTLRKYIRGVTSPSPVMSFLTGGNANIISGIRSDLIEASIQVPPVEPIKAPFAEWYSDSAERSERQLDSLEGLLELAESQNRLAPWMLGFAALAAFAAVVAAVVSIIG